MDAHLLFQARALEAVARAQGPVGAGDELGADEQRQAAGAGGGAFGARQHQMHHIGGEVLLAARDPDLLAGDPPAAVVRLHRLGAHQAEVGAALGLGEVHGARPLAGGHAGQVERLLGVVAEGADGGEGAVRQAGIHGEGHVGRGGHLVEGEVQHLRQALAAPLGLHRQGAPAGLDHGPVGGLEACRGGHRSGGRIVGAALPVAHRIQRLQHLLAKAPGLLQQLAGQVRRGVGETGKVGIGLEVKHLVQQEQVFLDRRLVGHRRLLESFRRIVAVAPWLVPAIQPPCSSVSSSVTPGLVPGVGPSAAQTPARPCQRSERTLLRPPGQARG